MKAANSGTQTQLVCKETHITLKEAEAFLLPL